MNEKYVPTQEDFTKGEEMKTISQEKIDQLQLQIVEEAQKLGIELPSDFGVGMEDYPSGHRFSFFQYLKGTFDGGFLLLLRDLEKTPRPNAPEASEEHFSGFFNGTSLDTETAKALGSRLRDLRIAANTQLGYLWHSSSLLKKDSEEENIAESLKRAEENKQRVKKIFGL